MGYTLRNILIASVLAVVALLLAISWLGARENDLKRGKTYIEVYVAKKDIPAGTPASSLESGGFIELTEVLQDDRAPQALGELKPVKDLSTNATVFEGEQLTARNFQENDQIAPDAGIKGNERIAAIPLNVTQSVGQVLKPGSHIDITTWDKDGVPWIVARDVVIYQTSDTLYATSSEEAADEKPEEAPSVDGDAQIYLLQASDKVMYDITFALANAEDGLYVWLRPSNGDQETKLPPVLPVPSTIGTQKRQAS